MTEAIPVFIVISVLMWGIFKKTDVQSDFCAGVEKGLKLCAFIFPNILIMLVAVTIFSKCGGTDFFARLISPLFDLFGIPVETAQIVLLRPFSGSGALALGREIMEQYGAESYIGRIAAVMLGASETSVYTIALYGGVLGIKNTGKILVAALCADMAAFLAAVWCVRFM